MADQFPPPCYGEGVKHTITWLLGDTTVPPIDMAGRGLHGPDSELPDMLGDAAVSQGGF